MESEYEKWSAEYEPNDMEDDDRLLEIKTAIQKLNTIQRKIFLTYVELGTYAATAREFGVSKPTAKRYINEIKKRLGYD